MPFAPEKKIFAEKKGMSRALSLTLKWTLMTGTITLIYDLMYFQYLSHMSDTAAQIFFSVINPIVVWRWAELGDWLYLAPMVYFYHFIFFGVTFSSFDHYLKRESEKGTLWLFLFALMVWGYLIQAYLFLILMGVVA